MEENQRLLTVISSLKQKLQEAQEEYEQLSKSVKMLNFGTYCLDQILTMGKIDSTKQGLGNTTRTHACNQNSIVFVPTQDKNEGGNSSTQSCQIVPHKPKVWIFHYCGKMGHIKPLCYKSRSKNTYQWIMSYKSRKGYPSKKFNSLDQN